MARKLTEVIIPESLESLGDTELTTLYENAVASFQAQMPADGTAPTEELLDTLDALANGIDRLKEERNTRHEAELARSDRAKTLTERILDQPLADPTVETTEQTAEKATESAKQPAADAPAAIAAGGAKPKVNFNRLRQQRKQRSLPATKTPTTLGLAAQGAAGFNVGQPMTVADMAKSINSRLGGFNAAAYAMARSRETRQSERFTIARLQREFPQSAVVQSEDPKAAMEYVTDEKLLPGGSLVASGGWCAPSETLYDLADITEAENLVSIPEIQINRGGIRYTLGPDFAALFADVGFCYTEAEDITGTYDGGTKPCTDVPCPPFVEVRLGYCGVCIGAGLLQQRGYPEAIEDYVTKSLNAHAHKVSAAVINSMNTQSTAVTIPGPQAGATAPILTSIDLQAAHYRAVSRMKDTATLEVLLPTWSKSLIRSDLARRLGVDLLDVSDARIAGWFSARNVNVQYVVDWQDIATTGAAAFTAFPSSIKFLLFAAGTFVKGVTDSITLENIYDSVLLGTNDYTALFTEDPYLVAKRLHDARVVTVPVCANGDTAAGVKIACTGAVTP